MLPVIVLLSITAIPTRSEAERQNSFPQSAKNWVDGSRYLQYAEPEDDLYKSPIRLALSKDGKLLYVVCENTHEVLAVDTESREIVGNVTVGKHPFGITLSPDGGRIYVSNRWDDSVSVIDVESMEVVETFPVGDDPHGIVTDATGAYLFVANMSESDVSVIETENFTEVKRLLAGRYPFDIARSPDERYIYVSNQMSNPAPFRTPSVLELTIIDAERQFAVDRRELFSTLLGQGVAVSPDNRFAVVALELPKNLIPETQIYQGWMVTHGFAIVETNPRGRAAYFLLDEPNLYYADAHGVVFSPDGRYLYISSSGVDTVSVLDMGKVYALLEIEDGEIGISDEKIRLYARNLGLSAEYVVARIPTGANPKGMVVSPDGQWIYVANRLSDSITVLLRTQRAMIDAGKHQLAGEIDLGGPGKVTVLRKGEKLFNHSSISFQKQLSCSTCHPENHLDGVVYDIAIDGIGRNWVDNRTMRGIAETAPFKWSGKNPNLNRQEGPRAAQLFFRSHGFSADENEAIVRFIETIPFPESRYLKSDGKLNFVADAKYNEFQKRGKKLFERAYDNLGRYIPIANRCITCHPPPFYTDRMMHDVGTQNYFDTSTDFDTPKLNNVYENAPFLHDGRSYSLEELWTTFNPDDLHGAANDMKKEQLNELIEYLKVLPPERGGEEARGRGGESLLSRSPAPTLPLPLYVGNQVCKSCHSEAYRIWVGSKHARTYVVLGTRMALKVGENAGIKGSPRDSAECLTCHANTAMVPEEHRAPGFHMEEGVKCESCHGPGENHAKKESMKDKEAAMEAELLIPKESNCVTCHKPKDSHKILKKKPFDYATFWGKIAHSIKPVISDQ
jgi:YVTN family beta-propeller protein